MENFSHFIIQFRKLFLQWKPAIPYVTKKLIKKGLIADLTKQIMVTFALDGQTD